MNIQNYTAWDKKAQELFIAQEMKKHYEWQVERLREELKKLSSETSTVGNEYIFVKEYRKGPIDYQLISELERIDFESYRKGFVEVWKLIKR